jgi:hypothetical protein
MHPACKNDRGILQDSKNTDLSGVFQGKICHISGERSWLKLDLHKQTYLYPKLKGYKSMKREKCGLVAVSLTVPEYVMLYSYIAQVRL